MREYRLFQYTFLRNVRRRKVLCASRFCCGQGVKRLIFHRLRLRRGQFVLEVSNVVRPIRPFVRNLSVHSVVLGGGLLPFHSKSRRSFSLPLGKKKMASITWSIYLPASCPQNCSFPTVTQFGRYVNYRRNSP